MRHLLSTLAGGLAVCSAGVHAQGKCDHSLSQTCIDAYGSAPVDFGPLFSKAPRFTYGFRVQLPDEWSHGTIGGSDWPGDANQLKAWFEYDNGTLNLNHTANRATGMAMILTNVTGDVSGGNTGCDGLLGEDCAANLKDLFKWTVILAEEYPQDVFAGLKKFQTRPLTNLSCPVNVFEESYDLTRSLDFASEYKRPVSLTGYRQTPIPSGNASYSWLREVETYRSAEDQMAFAAVGILARFPPTVPRAYDDIQVELVCLRPEAVEGSEARIETSVIPADNSTGDEDGGGKDENSARTRWFFATWPVISGAFVAGLSLL